jgi:hypothetical protein
MSNGFIAKVPSEMRPYGPHALNCAVSKTAENSVVRSATFGRRVLVRQIRAGVKVEHKIVTDSVKELITI